MASYEVGLMDRIQRRHLLATLIAEAIAAGRLLEGAVDFAGLLFGDPEIWSASVRHGDVVATAVDGANESSDGAQRLREKTRAAATRTIERDMVERLSIGDAQHRGGRGTSAKDTEYRRIRSRLGNYIDYLDARMEYQALNRRLREAYAPTRPGPIAAEVRAKEFALPKADVLLCEEEVAAFVAIMAETNEAAARSHVPLKQGRPRRGLVLMDKTGAPRWGEPHWEVDPDRSGSSSSETLATVNADPSGETTASALDEQGAADLRDGAILRARLGLALDADQEAALSPNWRDVSLTAERIVALMRYPRFAYLDDALAAFGLPPLDEDQAQEPNLQDALEMMARDRRARRLLHVNGQEPGWPEPLVRVPMRWRRAAIFYQGAREDSGERMGGRRWPEPWEYLNAPQPGLYSAKARRLVRQLLAINDIDMELSAVPTGQHGRGLEDLAALDPIFIPLVGIARTRIHIGDAVERLLDAWLGVVADIDAEIELPGFAD